MQDWVILVLGIFSVIMGSIVSIRWFQYRLLDPLTVTKRQKLQDDYTKDLEDEVEYWKKESRKYQGKYANAKQLPKSTVDEIPTEPNDIEAFVEQNLPSIANALPKEIGGLLLSNKEFVKQYVKQNPSIIEKFITKGSKETESKPSAPTYENVAV